MPVCGIYIYILCVHNPESACPYVVYISIYILCVHNPESACPYMVYIYIVCS